MLCAKCNERLYVKDVRHNNNLGETYRLYMCKKCGHIEYTSEFEIDASDKFIADWNKLHRHKPQRRVSRSNGNKYHKS